MRITGILTCQRTLGCLDEAESFLDTSELVHPNTPFIIGERTLGCWRSAAGADRGQR